MAQALLGSEAISCPCPRRSDAGHGRRHREDGTSPISMLFGVAMFLAFLLFTVQVLVHLYATSMVSAAAFDAARLVSARDGLDRGAGERHGRELLGEWGQRGDVSFDWSGTTGSEVVLRVTGPTPARFIRSVAELSGLDSIDRTVRVQVERFRTAP